MSDTAECRRQIVSERNIYETPNPLPQTRELRVVCADGTCAVAVQIRETWLEAALLRYLEGLLDRRDPAYRAQLQLWR